MWAPPQPPPILTNFSGSYTGGDCQGPQTDRPFKWEWPGGLVSLFLRLCNQTPLAMPIFWKVICLEKKSLCNSFFIFLFIFWYFLPPPLGLTPALCEHTPPLVLARLFEGQLPGKNFFQYISLRNIIKILMCQEFPHILVSCRLVSDFNTSDLKNEPKKIEGFFLWFQRTRIFS